MTLHGDLPKLESMLEAVSANADPFPDRRLQSCSPFALSHAG